MHHERISHDDQLHLCALAQDGDIKARDALVLGTMGFVNQIAHRYARGCPTLLPEDLMAEGALGVMKAIEKFDPSVGVKFLTYAANWIRAYVSRAAIYDKSRFGGSGSARSRGISARYRNDYQELSEAGLTDEEIADRLAGRYNMSKTVARAMPIFLRGVAYLDARIPSEENLTLLDSLRATGKSPDEETESRADAAEIRQTLRRVPLNERERAILYERLMADPPLTLADLGERFQLSRERLRQIEARLLGKLRVAFEAKAVDAKTSSAVVSSG